MLNIPVRKTIMIIEDDNEILDILELIFQAEGYDVFTSSNGQETNDLSKINPDLIMLDIQLTPGGNEGEEICTYLKSQEITRHIPIILLSAEMNIKQVFDNCGANDYLRKPFDIEDLSAKVKNLTFA